MFDWELVLGDTSALTKPYTAVITESTAKKYFGENDPIGQEIIFWNEHTCEVRGVIRDIPDNSHIKFTVLVSAETLHQLSDNQSRTAWGWYDFNTYIQLEEGTDPLEFQQKFAALAGGRAKRRMGMNTMVTRSLSSNQSRISTCIPICFRNLNRMKTVMQMLFSCFH